MDVLVLENGMLAKLEAMSSVVEAMPGKQAKVVAYGCTYTCSGSCVGSCGGGCAGNCAGPNY